MWKRGALRIILNRVYINCLTKICLQKKIKFIEPIFEKISNDLKYNNQFTARNVSKYEFFSGPYFPVFRLSTEIYGDSVRIRQNTDQKKLRILDTFRAFICKIA